MRRIVFLTSWVLVGAGACLENDPDYIPPDSSAASEGSGTDTSESGTGSESGTETSSSSSESGTDTSETSSSETSSTDTGVMCDAPLTECGGLCVDTQIDKNNCGECFTKCHPAQEQCVEGLCVPK